MVNASDLFLGGPLQGQQHVVIIFTPLKTMISPGLAIFLSKRNANIKATTSKIGKSVSLQEERTFL